jgi:hypothetical protein
MATTDEHEAEPLLIAVTSFWAVEDGNPVFIQEGDRMAGELPRRYARHFLPETTDTRTIRRAAAALRPV